MESRPHESNVRGCPLKNSESFEALELHPGIRWNCLKRGHLDGGSCSDLDGGYRSDLYSGSCSDFRGGYRSDFRGGCRGRTLTHCILCCNARFGSSPFLSLPLILCKTASSNNLTPSGSSRRKTHTELDRRDLSN